MYRCSNCGKETQTLAAYVVKTYNGMAFMGYALDMGICDLELMDIKDIKIETTYTCPNCHIIVTTSDSRAKYLLQGGKKENAD